MNKEVDENAQEVLKLRYFMDLPDGQRESNYSQLCRRVARVVAAGEYREGMPDEDLEYVLNIENSIYNDMMSHRFLFNSPTLFSAGVGISSNKALSKYLYKTLARENYEEIRDTYEKISKNYSKNQMMFACFTIEVPDSIEGIFDSVKNAAIISKFGGGVGANFGNLREKGALIAGGCGGRASGPVSFMHNWNAMGSSVVQGGKRRAALMGILNVHHPDIEEFVSCKESDGNLNYFNISVAVDDKFMEALRSDGVYDLVSPASGRVVKTVKARNLWDKICQNAHKNGDPGLFFIDTANRDNLLKSDGRYRIEATNPCLTGDTLVATADGRNAVAFKQLAEEGKDVPVYCLNSDNHIVVKTMRNPRVTGYDKDVYEIKLFDGSVIKATGDHKFKTESGEYKEVSELRAGDSLWVGSKILHDVELNRLEIQEKTREAIKSNFNQSSELRQKYTNIDNNTVVDNIKREISNLRDRYLQDRLAKKLEVCQQYTDLKCFINENSIYVEKYCEVCGKKFTVPFNRREISACSSECGHKLAVLKTNSSTTREERRQLIADKRKEIQERFSKRRIDLNAKLNKQLEKKESISKYSKGEAQAKLLEEPLPLEDYGRVRKPSQHYNNRIISISYIGKETVYNGTVDEYHNICTVLPTSTDSELYFVNSLQCGEQPLPNDSSCNLGSINLAEFVDENRSFNYKEFKDQVLRSVYYLDLVIDVTNYPLKKIEKNTKDIRPVGLGIMGLADACIMMGIKYGSREFEEFSLSVARILAEYSLIASAAIALLKGPYPHFDEESGERNYLTRVVRGSDISSSSIDSIVSEVIPNSDLPVSFKNALACVYNDRSYIVSDELVLELFKSVFSTERGKGGLRNSRRLSIAPTGTISILLNTSSGIEPNFSYEWTRDVVVSPTERRQLTYYHRLYNEENKARGLLVKAHDITPEQHVRAVAVFAPYIDSAISKTVNMPSESTVDDVRKIYEYCFDNGIKGVTIYRDGSRSGQPIKKIDRDESGGQKGRVRPRPQFVQGVTTKCSSPYGSIYITANFDDDKRMFETFISIGKSGSILKSITEALGRVISLALRSGVDIEDLVSTLSDIAGSEVWFYKSLRGKEIVVKSIPDAASKMLADLNKYYLSLYDSRKLAEDDCEEVKESPSIEEFMHFGTSCPTCTI
jgi:ribonucleoside-diphosphate reductase alpha chain